MNISNSARDAAERYHRFANDYPELAERALPEFIQSAMDAQRETPQLIRQTTPHWNADLCCDQPEITFRDPYKYVQ